METRRAFSSSAIRTRPLPLLPFLVYLVGVVLLASEIFLFVEGSSAPETLAPPRETTMATDSAIRVVFSDVDGTLVHYPEEQEKEEERNRILKLPPSATGMQGIISSRTLAYCRDLRQNNQKLVLISGMRTTTLLKRLPFLPRADAYCTYNHEILYQ